MAHARTLNTVTVNKADFWRRIQGILAADRRCALLCVVESTGSSPGRKGFKMAVAEDGAMFGSIGGGRMEHKLVELARSLLAAGSSSSDPTAVSAFPFLKRQIHQAGIGQDRSGMICSGEQTVAFFLLGPGQRQLCMEMVAAISAGGNGQKLILSSNGLAMGSAGTDLHSPVEWSYDEPISAQPRIVILGAGHVGLALSRTMNQLGFHVHLMDDRPGLNTMEANEWAHERSVVDYATIGEAVPWNEELYVVLVSFGYRTDEILLRQLIRKRFRYIGMLGSAEKIRTLFDEMRKDGHTEEELARVHAPIGILINSRTPEEIAVSIAAEIIAAKNG